MLPIIHSSSSGATPACAGGRPADALPQPATRTTPHMQSEHEDPELAGRHPNATEAASPGPWHRVLSRGVFCA
jgi:hypothetical protein